MLDLCGQGEQGAALPLSMEILSLATLNPPGGVPKGPPAQVVAPLGGGLGVVDPQVVAQTTQNARKQPGDMHLADP